MTRSSEDLPAIIYFGNDWSADNKTSSHHIAKRLLRDHKLVYVECPGMRSPQGSSRDIKKIFSKLFKVFEGPKALDERSYVFTLFQIPFHSFKTIQYINKKLIVLLVKRLCKKLKIDKPILWFVIPHVALIVGKIDSSLVVYYCTDDFSELPGVNKQMISQMDEYMFANSDLAFVTSEPLYQNKIKYKDKLNLSRHGVDFDHFNTVFKKSNTLPDKVKNLSGPVIGFFGLIETWIDLPLIKYLAESKPDWNFVMIGRVAINIDEYKNIKNIHFLGVVTYDELPAYAQSFDVAIIPCMTNELIRNFNPLKLREYLAMGVPVVSTYFPEIDEFSDIVSIANNYDEFLHEVNLLVSNDNSEVIQKGIDKVSVESWEVKYKLVKEKVYNKLS